MTGGAVVGILRLAVVVVWVVVLGRVLFSWFDPIGRTQAGRMLIQLTEPVLAPIRSLLPRTGALDLSPLVVFIVLSIVMRVLL